MAHTHTVKNHYKKLASPWKLVRTMRKCGAVNLDHAHVFWFCPEVVQFWDDVHFILANILVYEVPNSCTVLYFGNMAGNIVAGSDRCLFNILVVACKKAMTQRWY